MTDFREIAKKAKQEHEASLASATVAEQERQARVAQSFSEAVSQIERDILPILEQARAAFDKESIPLVIETNFTESPYSGKATLSFRLRGPEMRSRHGGKFTPESHSYFFERDNEKLSFGKGKRGGRFPENMRSINSGILEQIESSLGEAAATYYAEVRESA